MASVSLCDTVTYLSLFLPDNTLYPLGGQHFVLSCQEIRKEREQRGLDIPHWMSHVRTVIIVNCPLSERQRISGLLNKVTQLSRKTTNAEMLRLFERDLDDDVPILTTWQVAVEKAGLTKIMRQEHEKAKATGRSKTTREKTGDELVCYFTNVRKSYERS